MINAELEYAYSAIAQVVAAILAITLTFRVILSQRLKYRFPLKIVGKFSKDEILYFLIGTVLIVFSIFFLLIEFNEVYLPSIIVLTIITITLWIGSLLSYYKTVQTKLSLDHLLKEALLQDEIALLKWNDYKRPANEPQLILYDLIIQMANQKDFQLMEKALSYLATLSHVFPSLIINQQIGEICRQFIRNPSVFDKCLNTFYILISPIKGGVYKSGSYMHRFLDFKYNKKQKQYKNVKEFVKNRLFGESSTFNERNIPQTNMELDKLLDRYLLISLGEEEHKHREKKIAVILLSAYADFVSLEEIKKEMNPDYEPQNLPYPIFFFLHKIDEKQLKGATEEVSIQLNTPVFFSNPPRNLNNDGESPTRFASKILCGTADTLEAKINHSFPKLINGTKINIPIVRRECGEILKKDWIELPEIIRHTNKNCPAYAELLSMPPTYKFPKNNKNHSQNEDFINGYWVNKDKKVPHAKLCESCKQIEKQERQERDK